MVYGNFYHDFILHPWTYHKEKGMVGKYLVTPSNTRRQGTNKSHLLLVDFCYYQYRNKKNGLKGPRLDIP